MSDGNSDVDHVSNEISVQHITSNGLSTLTGNNFLFFRTCVSQHNTLGPNIYIRVEVQCIGDDLMDGPSTTVSTVLSTIYY